mmetsp:Transcript_61685/g.201296  ORF Transcript_61685/g.201296 Transcript_61685/m.201296 type:complete len:215 (+) Transcript_61685:448-1092(+)
MCEPLGVLLPPGKQWRLHEGLSFDLVLRGGRAFEHGGRRRRVVPRRARALLRGHRLRHQEVPAVIDQRGRQSQAPRLPVPLREVRAGALLLRGGAVDPELAHLLRAGRLPGHLHPANLDVHHSRCVLADPGQTKSLALERCKPGRCHLADVVVALVDLWLYDCSDRGGRRGGHRGHCLLLVVLRAHLRLVVVRGLAAHLPPGCQVLEFHLSSQN